MRTTATPLENTEEGRAFLQHRLARFGLFGSALGWFFLVFRVITASIEGHTQELTSASMYYHFGGAASLLSLWFMCRSGKRTAGFLRGADTTTNLLACTFYSLMGLSLPPLAMPHFTVLLALSFGHVARAVYVPSSASRTILLTSLSGIPFLVTTYLLYHNLDLNPWFAAAKQPMTTTPGRVAVNITVYAAAWWLCAIAICGSTSKVIYGLRREVRDVRRLGQYTLVEKLGEGGMGMVYRARHAMLRRPTAIKLLTASKSGDNSIARFEKEVQLTAGLSHPNTITVFDYGRTPDGVFYYAMELLDGATLAELVATSGAQPPARVIHVLDEASGALAEAHKVNLIHRDIKPTNIMVVERGGKPDVTKVLDFGLVKELDRSDGASLTQADQITGTPQYLSPESITAPDEVDARSDIYALGAVGYFLLTGEHVFTGATVVEVCSAHLHQAPVPPSERTGIALPADLEALIMRCLAKSPDDRPASAAELQRLLRQCKDAGEWTDERARDWWRNHQQSLQRRRQDDSVTGSGLTIDIDLARRRTAAR